ncbi:4a-hydroxytetrahydrobiopterin dehydratase [Arthrobacter crusticola]|uniref:Putative pterin-4-alpha-carbinolamine dehydratase n=1 Tax=Arthrobacter crusticola TaxID=2547960 RepID=A0A4R5U3D8_9MICC|nr:4a-hydroxytetrahydrobiopterin dehydratase [Arthrobacter crusticola]TDK28196.1 4a-hydroxytetrahydrobiopterin dehydratase [Arthrobacter crusticola]
MPAGDVLNQKQIQANLLELPEWRYGLGALRTALRCESSATALDLLSTIGGLAQETDHHPDVDWRYDTLFVTLTSHDAGGRVTARDVTLARAISTQAQAAGATPRPELLRTVEIAIDTDAPEAISDVWRTALGYKRREDGSLTDPYGRGPAIWFQETQSPNVNRLHVDVTVPFSESASTLDSLASVGATLDHDHAPMWVVASDAQGNRLCISTEAGRGD